MDAKPGVGSSGSRSSTSASGCHEGVAAKATLSASSRRHDAGGDCAHGRQRGGGARGGTGDRRARAAGDAGARASATTAPTEEQSARATMLALDSARACEHDGVSGEKGSLPRESRAALEEAVRRCVRVRARARFGVSRVFRERGETSVAGTSRRAARESCALCAPPRTPDEGRFRSTLLVRCRRSQPPGALFENALRRSLEIFIRA